MEILTQVIDKREATRQPRQQQAKEAVSVQLHSEMAMRSEIIMQPRPDPFFENLNTLDLKSLRRR